MATATFAPASIGKWRAINATISIPLAHKNSNIRVKSFTFFVFGMFRY
jgi:hypothetical protein